MKKIDITPQELCERLFNGERFYNREERTLTYSKQKKKFVAFNRDGESYNPDMNVWFKDNLYTKPHWTDNLSEENPVLCWLRKDRQTVAGLTIGKIEDGYALINGQWYSYAEPVKLEDACIWEGSDE